MAAGMYHAQLYSFPLEGMISSTMSTNMKLQNRKCAESMFSSNHGFIERLKSMSDMGIPVGKACKNCVSKRELIAPTVKFMPLQQVVTYAQGSRCGDPIDSKRRRLWSMIFLEKLSHWTSYLRSNNRAKRIPLCFLKILTLSSSELRS